MLLAEPWWLWLLWLVPLVWLGLRRKGYLGHSHTRLLPRLGWTALVLEKLPLLLFSLALACLLLSLARPQIKHVDPDQLLEGRDIIVFVDVSGSMELPFRGQIPEPQKLPAELSRKLPEMPTNAQGAADEESKDKGQRRIDAAQAAVLRFVEGRFLIGEGDRMAIGLFSDQPRFCWPLTDDLKIIYRNGLFVSQVVGGGTNFGEDKPGPIDEAAAHFEELGKSKTRVLILVTDGENDIGWWHTTRLRDLITSHHMRFYVISVRDSNSNDTADIQALAESVGGGVYRARNAQELAGCFDSISQTERSVMQVDDYTVNYEEIFFYPAALSIIFFLLALVVEALILGQ